MALTRRQKWRIEKVQSEKIARANKALTKTENNKLSDEKEQQGLVITRYGQRQLVESLTGSSFSPLEGKILDYQLLVTRYFFSQPGVMKG